MIMGCNVGPKFDLSKLVYDKIILSSDADVDGLFIQSLLLSFYFKIFPEIIMDGRLFIAVPPLYRVDDKNNPFVINNEDYINRYVKEASKNYKIGYVYKDDKIEYFDNKKLIEFLSDTSLYVEDIYQLSKHYKANDRLIEMIFEEISLIYTVSPEYTHDQLIDKINIQHLLHRINEEFPEISYKDNNKEIYGIANEKRQLIEISTQLVRKGMPCIKSISKWRPMLTNMIMRNVKTGSEERSSLLGILKNLARFQPNKVHRFKGLGENSDEDIKTTIMDPNTRTLIRVNISDIENDMKIFQMLRGGSPLDALNRKTMIRNFEFSRSDIDT